MFFFFFFILSSKSLQRFESTAVLAALWGCCSVRKKTQGNMAAGALTAKDSGVDPVN